MSDSGPRVASLLPSATEIVQALGLESTLVAVSHFCDFPGRVETLPRATSTRVPSGAAGREIDQFVRDCLRRGESLYRLDEALLARLRPDVIVTQSLCEVCAVGQGEVERAMPLLRPHPSVITLEPRTLEEMLDGILIVAVALRQPMMGVTLVRELRRRVEAVHARTARRRQRPRVAFLEWADPPISGGHWNPELVELAGGLDGLGVPGRRCRTLEWEEILEWRPDVMVLACCGFDEARGREELELLRQRPGFDALPCARSGRVHVMDGVRLFSRPGPSLVDGLERLAAVLGD
ncbi:MAG TPA: ABC transporter substrate-binding protein [Gemmatimonadales bacterium]|jgi:iron complex transport system substrate-binding protein